MNVKDVVNIDRIPGTLTRAINWHKVQHSFSFSNTLESIKPTEIKIFIPGFNMKVKELLQYIK